ncbi:DUF2798 domain-containing protein [Algiphilus sp. NNCM1]|nr:DUF2798 domain-containing protein [Algiphilus acroporae]
MCIPIRYGHLVFGVIQSGMTCLIATGIASVPSIEGGAFLWHWLRSWALAWITMLPFVVLAAPLIQRAVWRLTR